MEVYNKNRDNNHSMHDEIREQNAKLKGAPFREKLSYFQEYYLKTTLLVIAAVIFIGYIAHSMLTAPSDTAFAAYFFNDTGDSSNTELIDGFVEYLELDTSAHEAYIDATMNYIPDSGDINVFMSLEKTMAVISTSELDVVVGDAETADYFAKSECLHDITTVLPDDLLTKFKDKLYYAEVGEAKELVPVGIYVTDSPKLNEYYYYVDREPILGFIINSNSMDNAIAFLRYIYTENQP
ncbi:MAG: hypothetical protein K2P44_05565 [Lachnospiraceae bacterium]|nr:hypothetical protein [Lachnospiraceae bacterium]